MAENEKMLVSKSETIGALEIRSLLEVTNTMKMALTMDEFAAIMMVYSSAIERLLKENGEPI